MTSSGRPQLVGFLLLPRSPLLAYSAATVALDAANYCSGRLLYEIASLSCDGQPVAAHCGTRILPDRSASGKDRLDYAFVCSGNDPESAATPAVLSWLRHQARAGARVGGLSSAAHVLAKAGLLKGRRATIHWEQATEFRERFPDADLRQSVFEIDENRLTSSGGVASLDLALNVIAQDHGLELAADVSHMLQLSRIRSQKEEQESLEFYAQQVGSWVVAEAIRCVKTKGCQNLSPGQLAAEVGVSQRQLERLFRRYLNRTPKRFITELRLQRAQDLICTTPLTIFEVAAACGFDSRSGFHNAYVRHFGRSPASDRRAEIRLDVQ